MGGGTKKANKIVSFVSGYSPAHRQDSFQPRSQFWSSRSPRSWVAAGRQRKDNLFNNDLMTEPTMNYVNKGDWMAA